MLCSSLFERAGAGSAGRLDVRIVRAGQIEVPPRSGDQECLRSRGAASIFCTRGLRNRGVARYVAQCSGEASLGAAIHGAPRPHPQRLQQRRDATGAGMVRERGPFERELLQHGDDHAFAGMLPTAHERRSDIEIGVAVQDHIALEGEGMARARIFTPPAEIPFAGHTTFGAALVLAAARQAHGRRAPAA